MTFTASHWRTGCLSRNRCFISTQPNPDGRARTDAMKGRGLRSASTPTPASHARCSGGGNNARAAALAPRIAHRTKRCWPSAPRIAPGRNMRARSSSCVAAPKLVRLVVAATYVATRRTGSCPRSINTAGVARVPERRRCALPCGRRPPVARCSRRRRWRTGSRRCAGPGMNEP